MSFSFSTTAGNAETRKERLNLKFNIMANFYCEYCGQKFSSVSSLTSNSCSKHPNGSRKGMHKLYEGTEKTKYTCKYCGSQFSTLTSLTSNSCSKHPNGSRKGMHAPAL